MKKIIAIACDQGPANNMHGALALLKDKKDLEIVVISENPATYTFEAKSFEPRAIRDYGFNELTSDVAIEILKKENPDLVFTGISAVSDIERFFLYAAKEVSDDRIKTVSILDGNDFSSVKLKDTKVSPKYRFRPDYVLVINSDVLENLIEEGFNRDQLVITGLPSYDHLINLKKLCNPEGIATIRKELGVNQEDYLVTFLSQALLKTIPTYAIEDHGYTELTALEALETSLAELNIPNLYLFVRSHPSEDLGTTRTALKGKLERVILSKSHDSRRAMVASDLVTGMFSTLLPEAPYLDKNVFSVKPCYTFDDTTQFIHNPMGFAVPTSDRLITNKIGLSIPAYKKETVTPNLYTLMHNDYIKYQLIQKRSKLVLDGMSTQRAADTIYKILENQ
ncbi:CDP-glycerol glycerophosphotransferase family protein [Candidatus Woesearchaeota archaeon]|nr:CDP-glycerol glycerophosphotransferase family protein [Candidatus Woesearchaeota archaeon]